MINLKTTLDTIAADTEDAIPAIVAPLGIADFPEYCQGPPRDSEKATCSIMYDPMLSIDVVEERIPILFWLQLFEVEYEDALLYCTAIQTFIAQYDPHRIGMVYVDAFSIDIVPIDRGRTTDCYLSATFVNPKDSCDD